MKRTALMMTILAPLAACASEQTRIEEVGYVVPQTMKEPVQERVVEVPVPVAVDPPKDVPRRKVSEMSAVNSIRDTRIMVDPNHAIGGTYTPSWMDGFPIPVYAAANIVTDIEFPAGANLEYFGGSDMEDGGTEGQVAGWHVKTSYAGRGDQVMYKAHVMPRYKGLKTQFTANLTMPDGSPRTILFLARSFDTTRMNAVRPVMEDMKTERMNASLLAAAQDRKSVLSGANSGNRSICGVGSDTRYNVTVDEQGLEWAQMTRGKVYNDGKFTCIEFPPEGPKQELPDVMIVMGKGQEFTANCTLMGRHYVCDGVPTRLRLRGVDGGKITIERTSN